MAELEDLIWEQASRFLFVPKEQYLAELRTYDVEPVSRDGLLLGAVMRKGPELHFVTFKTGPIGRDIVRRALDPQLDRYGYVETKTPKVDARQHRFNRVMGFVAVGEDQYNVHYRLDRGRSATHHRSTACPLPRS